MLTYLFFNAKKELTADVGLVKRIHAFLERCQIMYSYFLHNYPSDRGINNFFHSKYEILLVSKR